MSDNQREELPIDVLFVGAGAASLAGAIHLKRESKKNGLDLEIAIIEKASEVGAHSLSGAVVDPISLIELFPELNEGDFPFESPITAEKMYFLQKPNLKIPFPYIPKGMSHHGCYVASIGKLVRWLGEKCEQEGIDVFCPFSGDKILYNDNGGVAGIRTRDRGVDKNGNKKPTYEEGVDIKAKVTVFGEGTRGSLSKELISKFDLMKDKTPQVWAVGVKELWKVPEGRINPGYVAHTLGHPLGAKIFGGGFIYGMQNNILDIGLVTGLDYSNPNIDPHHELQLLKTHGWVKDLLKDGELMSYGAKSLPEGGYYSMPKLFVNGALLIGDSAGFLNGMRLKGIHLAMKSGMLAAETIIKAFKESDFSETTLSEYESLFNKSWAYKELYKARNFHQGFKKGALFGMMNAGLALYTGGRGFGIFNKLEGHHGHEQMKKISNQKASSDRYKDLVFDGKTTFDKATDMYYSATKHDEDQTAHLKIIDPDICFDKCKEEYGNPCQHFCPAGVYEITQENEKDKLQINFSNCVHCKTCDIMDPYQVIDWTVPESGGGPSWKNM
ncbi:MAG: electron transfer flavoprotein [Candidatus Marinimicrobia bacterium]|nr:electron transfer flavoprotein [Candidatus Neomarinimicrobiota bacterium]|tara:strand:+ start:8476 stop:10140 length:1665 start_codon:yes stop_codon:yes gene_type:complete